MKSKTDNRTTGQRIRDARAAAGLTQAELAERAQTTQDHVSLVERDRHEPKLDLLRRFARVLGCQPGELVGAEPDPTIGEN